MNSKRILITLSILLIASFFGCKAIFEDGKDMAKVAKNQINQLPAESLELMIENGEEFLLIDIRQPAEYEAGHISGSFSIPRGELEFLISDEYFWEEQFMYVPLKEDKIILYCENGDRGTLAAKSLQKLGFTNVYNLIDGYMGFVGEDAPKPVKTESGGCG